MYTSFLQKIWQPIMVAAYRTVGGSEYAQKAKRENSHECGSGYTYMHPEVQYRPCNLLPLAMEVILTT